MVSSLGANVGNFASLGSSISSVVGLSAGSSVKAVFENINKHNKHEVEKVAKESTHWAIWVGHDWDSDRNNGTVFEIGGSGRQSKTDIKNNGMNIKVKTTPYGYWKQKRMKKMNCVNEKDWKKRTNEDELGETPEYDDMIVTIDSIKVSSIK